MVSFLLQVQEGFPYLLSTSTVREVSHCSPHPLVLAVSPHCPCPSFVLRDILGSCFGGSWSRASVGSASSRLGAPRGAVGGSLPASGGKGSVPRVASARGSPGCELGGRGLSGAKPRKWHKDPNVAKSALREIQSRQRREKINA